MSRRKQSRPFRVQEDNDIGLNSDNGAADISTQLTLETCSNLNTTQLISSNSKLLQQTGNTLNITSPALNQSQNFNNYSKCNGDFMKTKTFHGIKDTNDDLYKENGYSTSSCSEDNSSLPEHRFCCECEENFTEEEDYQEHKEICDVRKQTMLDNLKTKAKEVKVKNEFIDEDTENSNNINKIEEIDSDIKQVDTMVKTQIAPSPTPEDSNPNAPPFVPGHVTFEELQNTKVAVAQYAASILANNGDSETAIKDLALLQSTLFALQNQQVFQMQMMQQFHTKLSLGQIPKENNELSDDELNQVEDEHIEIDNKIEEDDSSDMESNEMSENDEKIKSVNAESNKKIHETELENNKKEDPLDYSAGTSMATIEKNNFVLKEDTEEKSLEKVKSLYLMPDQCDEPKCTSSTLNQLASSVESSINYHNSSMSGVITNHDTPPSLDGPNSLEMLQKHAQDVLDSASQGLLSGNLADELAFSKDKMSLYDEKGNRNESFFKHRCRYCGKVFGSDSALQIHIRSHTGERPFKCNICGSRFTTKGNLKVHFQRHTARFPHIQMNPHPVPEHLDKYHPPLLDQMSPEQDEYSNYPQPNNGNLSVPFLRPPGASNLPVYAPSMESLMSESQSMFKSHSEEQSIPADLSKSHRIPITHLKPDKEIVETIPTNLYESDKKDNQFEDCISIESNDNSNDSFSSQKNIESRKDEAEISSTINDSSMDSKCNGVVQDLRCESESKPIIKLSDSRSHISRPSSVLSDSKKEVVSLKLPVLESKKPSTEKLSENTGTSETSKLQLLVNSIENNVTNPNECVVCHRILSCKKALHTHYLTHTGEKPFLCRICGRTFTTKGNLKTHIGIHNLQFPMRSSHQCPVCHKQYLNSQVLQQHIKTHTGDQLEISEEEIHAAEIRDFPIMSPEAYSRMMSLYESRNILEKKKSSFGSSSSIADDEYVEDDENMTESSLSLVAIKNQVRAINTIKLQNPKYNESHENKSQDTLKHFKGDKINGAISTTVNLSSASNDETSSSHTESSEGALDLTPRTNAAKLLNNTFPITSSYTKTLPFMNNNFSSHQMISNSPFNFLSISGVRGNTTCKICFKTFACYSALDTHYRSHTKEKPFKCKVCDRGFSTKGNMKQHMLTHNMSNHITESVNSNSNSSDGGNADYQSSEMSTTMHDYPDIIHPMNLSSSNNFNKNPIVMNENKINLNKEFNHRDREMSFLPKLEEFKSKFFDADHNNKHIKQEITGVKRSLPDIEQPLAKRQSFSGCDTEHTPEKIINNTFEDVKSQETAQNSDSEEIDDPKRDTESPMKIIKSENHLEITSDSIDKDKEKMFKEFTDNSPLAQLSQYEEQHYQKQQLQQQQQQQQQMQLHQQAVNELPNTKHLCVVCRKNFSSSSALQIHMRTHTGDKPFKCSVCRKAFTTKGNLKVHMGTHMWTNTTSHRGRRMSLELPLNRPHPMNSQDSELLQRRPDLFYPYLPSPFLNGMHQKISEMHMLQQTGHGLPNLLPPQDINMPPNYAGLFGFAGLMPNQVLPYSPSPSPVSSDKQLNSPKNNKSDIGESPASPRKSNESSKPQPLPRIQRQWDMQYEHNDNKSSKMENGVEGKALLKPYIRNDGLSI